MAGEPQMANTSGIKLLMNLLLVLGTWRAGEGPRYRGYNRLEVGGAFHSPDQFMIGVPGLNVVHQEKYACTASHQSRAAGGEVQRVPQLDEPLAREPFVTNHLGAKFAKFFLDGERAVSQRLQATLFLAHCPKQIDGPHL